MRLKQLSNKQRPHSNPLPLTTIYMPIPLQKLKPAPIPMLLSKIPCTKLWDICDIITAIFPNRKHYIKAWCWPETAIFYAKELPFPCQLVLHYQTPLPTRLPKNFTAQVRQPPNCLIEDPSGTDFITIVNVLVN